ncbi:hypothetical protein [Paraburkholderia terrae]
MGLPGLLCGHPRFVFGLPGLLAGIRALFLVCLGFLLASALCFWSTGASCWHPRFVFGLPGLLAGIRALFLVRLGFLLASALCFWSACVAPVRGGTYFSLPPQRKIGKRKRLTPPTFLLA